MRIRSGFGVLPFICMTGLIGASVGVAHADPVELVDFATPYTQDFNTLDGTTGGIPLGWMFLESGSSANTSYSIGTGSGTSGDTYGFGASAADRAFGGLQSGSVNPRIGAQFHNGSATTIHSLRFNYTGEQWRLGASGREDRIEFYWSQNATGIADDAAVGGWIGVPALNFVAPITSGSNGLRDGNSAAARTLKTHHLTNLDIAPGESFFIRWTDFNPSGSDDGLAVDDFSLTVNAATSPAIDFIKEFRVDGTSNPDTGDIVDVDLYFENAVNTGGSGDVEGLIITDIVPAGLVALDENFVADFGAGSLTFTTARDGDAGEIVDGVLTVDVGPVAADDAILISYQARIETLSAPVAFASTASASFASGTPSETYTATAKGTFAPTVSTDLAFVVFFDTNGNGTQDSGELGLPGWGFLITGSAIVTTDDDGLALFADLTAGDVDVLVEAAAADGMWSFIEPTTATVVAGVRTTILIAVGCSCDDSNVCTPNDSCDRGVCAFNAPIDCGDGDDPCISSTCDAVEGCVAEFTTADCDDGDDTTRDDVCDGAGECAGSDYTCTPGSCEVSSVPNGVDCDVIRVGVGESCDDGDNTTRNDMCGATGPCAGTPYVCPPSTDPCVAITPDGTDCQTAPINAGGACNDGDAMTRNDVCDADGACAGESYECPASTSPCIENVENGTACTPTPINIGGSCDDGSTTTQNDVCSAAGVCAGTPYVCPPSGNPCISNLPDGTGCTATPINPGGSCNDGVSTTRGDVCDAEGACAGQVYECPASTNPCIDNVENGTDCTPTPINAGASCNDGNTNTNNDLCDATGVCAGTLYTCPASSTPCITNVANGTDCTETPTNAGGSCNDGDLTTRNDVCDAVGGCAGSPYSCTPSTDPCLTNVQNGTACAPQPTNLGGSCDDGNTTTRNDVCDAAGVCVGTSFECPASTNPCITNVANGTDCTETPTNAGGTCDDSDTNTRNDVCDAAGVCAGEAYTCDAPTNVCRASVPDGSTCVEVDANEGGSCDDEELDTRLDKCVAGVCAGTPYTCERGPCEALSRTNGEDCDIEYEDPMAPCDDGDDTTRLDKCTIALECIGEAYTCTPGPCEATSVPNGASCSVTFKPANESCDDSNVCTTDDVCNDSGLCEGEVVTCDAGFSCDPTGECIATHCTSCGDDAGCSNGSSCLDLGGETGKVCLLGCTVDDDCADEQVCRALGDSGMFCFDLEGQCEAPPVEPGPDAEVESGPESVPVEPGPEAVESEVGPEVVEGGPDAAAEVAEGEVIWSGGGSGCGGGSPAGAGLVMLAMLMLAVRFSRKRMN